MYNGIIKFYILIKNSDRKNVFIMFMIDVLGVLIIFFLLLLIRR